MVADTLAEAPLAPSRWQPLRKIFLWTLATVTVAAAGALAGSSWYIAQHRELQVVNGFRVPVEVTLDDGPPLTVRPGERIPVTLAEGPHSAKVTAAGQVLTDTAFDMSSDFMARLYKRPAFVLNAGGGAAVMWEETVYGRPASPGGMRLYVGQAYVMFDDVSYPFAQFPETLRTQGFSVRKTRVEILPISAEQVLSAPLNVVGISDRLALAEAHLKLAPDNQALIGAYRQVSQEHGQADRARQFLAGQGTERR